MFAPPSLIPNVHDPHVGASLQPESGMVDRQPARFIIGTDFQDVGLLGVAESIWPTAIPSVHIVPALSSFPPLN